MAYNIRRGVKKPTTSVRPPLPKRDSIYPFDKMEVGDCFLIPNKPKNTMSSLVYAKGKELGRQFSSRLVWMAHFEDGWDIVDEGTEGSVKGIGIWREA